MSFLARPRLSSFLCNHYSKRNVSSNSRNKYDLIVIGGGSGGLACAKEAGILGKTVAVLDYVDPTPKGAIWGLGGTCVNVGCIPKKLYHQAALLGDCLNDARSFGWNVNSDISHNWDKLRSAVIQHIKSLNWGYRIQLKQKKVDYFNAKGKFKNSNEIELSYKSGKKESLFASNFAIAVGGRPKYPNIPGAVEFGITSDDLFSLEKPPRKTLVIGGSYVALECAGFLTGLGFDTTVMVRSICLRGFDQQMASLVSEHMTLHGTKFLQGCIPVSLEKNSSGVLTKWINKNQIEEQDIFDTVLFAVGRQAQTSCLGLSELGVKIDSDSGKIFTNNEQSTVLNIYAVGDVVFGKPELTPVAIKAGKLLAHRLFGNSTQQMNYDNVATTVFTPLEYGCVGLSEEDAIQKFGEDKIETYHAFYKPLEYTIPQKDSSKCYIKAVCERAPPQKILGLHMLSPAAGEIIQGFSAAVNCGLTMESLHNTVGIHPTTAEEVVKLNITKRSGLDPVVTGC